MKISTLSVQLSFVLTTLITHAAGDFTVQAKKLEDWTGCDDKQKTQIRAAWDEAIDIAYVSSGKIDWDYYAGDTFLGNHKRNKDYQKSIKAVLNNAHTFKRAYWWNPQNWRAWKTSIHCGDWDGTCEKYPTAAAYTVNPGKRDSPKKKEVKDTITICPKVWKRVSTCADSLEKHGMVTNPSSNLNNFQCRGYVILHELFHLDSLSKVSGQGRIKDRDIRYQSGFDPVKKWYPAYGPTRTKVLAGWPKDDLGKWIVTNVDNLAQYSLSRWVQTHTRLFPGAPGADGTIDTTYNPRFIEEPYPEVNVTSIAPQSTTLNPDTHYLECNNNGGMEWATAPSVTQKFAESTIEKFCNTVGPKNIAVKQSDDPACATMGTKPNPLGKTSDAISPDECKKQLSAVFNSCDTNSIVRKFGGVSITKCAGWIAAVNGSRGAFKDSNAPWSCSLLVRPDSLSCACTDGNLYPLLNETCPYDRAPSTPPLSSKLFTSTRPAPTTFTSKTPTPTSSPAPQPTSSTSPPSSAPTAPNMSSPACVACTNDLGASTCGPLDGLCLVDQCQNDTNCQACKINCVTFFSDPGATTGVAKKGPAKAKSS